MPYSNSTIFRTINADATTLTKSMGLLGKSFHDIKKDFSNGQGFRTSLFSTSISNSDFQSLQKFNSALNVTNDGLTKSQRISKAWSENMTGCSMAAKRAGNDIITGKKNIKDFSNEMQNSTRSTIGLTVAQTALNIAISMGLMAAISLAIKGFDKMINHAKRASEAADEAFEETSSKVQEQQEELKTLDELISKYRELKKDGTLDIEGRKEVKELQNDIADLVGTQARNLDLVNGKLDDEIEKLDEISAKEAKKAYETATANYNNSQRANQNAAGDDSYMFFDGYAYTGSREKDAEKILKEYGFGNNVSSGGFFGSTLFITDSFDNDMNALEGAQEKADYLQSMIDVLEQNGQRATELYSGLISQRDKYLGYIDSQQGAANSLVNSWITYSQYSNEELSNITVNSVESFEAYRQKMIEAAKNDESVGKLLSDGTLSEKDLETAVNDFMATSTKFSDWYKQWIGDVQDTGGNANRMTVSLSDLEKASDGISSLGSAFKELSDEGYITTKTLSGIQEASGLAEEEWNKYETALLNAKKGSKEFNDVISDLTYKILEHKLDEGKLADATEDQIEAILRENGVLNANAVAESIVIAEKNKKLSQSTELAQAYLYENYVLEDLINKTEDEIATLLNEEGISTTVEERTYLLAQAKEILRIQSELAKATTAEEVVALAIEAAQAGITGVALNNLVMEMGIFNNSLLDVSQKVAALQEMGYYARWTAQGLKEIDLVKRQNVLGNNYIASYDKNGKLLGVEKEQPVEIPEMQIPEITIPNYSGNASNGSSKKDTSADEEEKKRIEAYKSNLETRMNILDRYKAHIDTLDFGLDIINEDDFDNQREFLSLQIKQATEYGEELKEAFEDAASSLPKTSEELDALSSHLSKLGDNIRDNISSIRAMKIELEKANIEAITTRSQGYIDELSSEIEKTERRIELLKKDDSDSYKYTNQILGMQSLLPNQADINKRIREKSAEDKKIIQIEQDTQDKLDEILREQIKKNEDLRENERQALLAGMDEMQQETSVRLKTALNEYNTYGNNVIDTTTRFTDAVSNAVNNMKLTIPKPDTSRFNDAAKDIKDSLTEVHNLLGETPGAFNTFAEGTAEGNKKASNLGIAGENHKPEILVDKKTGEFEYIDKPTLIDTSKTDVIGEKETAKIPKFANGTVDDITSVPLSAEKMYEGLKSVSNTAKGYGAVYSARQFLGVPYVWGGTSPDGVDCSGLTYLAWQRMGVDIGRTTYFQYPNSQRISRAQLKPGDLLFNNFGAMGLDGPGHVGMYIGNGRVIESPRTGAHVYIHSNLDKWAEFGHPFYASGTPIGNANASRFGIAGENFKPEILIDKATGEATYINKPTVIDTNKTDVVGERATAAIPKFASGTPTNDKQALAIIKTICDKYGIPYEIALSILDQESGGVIKLSKNKDASAYSHTSWQLYDGGGVWNGISKEDQNFIEKAAEEGENGDNFYKAWEIATDYALKYLSDKYKSLGSWQAAAGAYNGSGTEGAYAKAVIERSETQPFLDAAESLKETTDTIAEESKEVVKTLSPQEEEINNITGDFESKYTEAYSKLNAKNYLLDIISLEASDSENYNIARDYYKNTKEFSDKILPEAMMSYKSLIYKFNEYLSSGGNDQNIIEAYTDAIDDLGKTIMDTEERVAGLREGIVEYVDDELSTIDDIIDDHDFYSNWSNSEKTKLEYLSDYEEIINKAHSDGIIFEREKNERLKDIERRKYDATEEEMVGKINNIEKRIESGNLYNNWEKWLHRTDSELRGIADQINEYTKYFKNGHLSKERFNELVDELKDRAYTTGKDALYALMDNAISQKERAISDEKEYWNFLSSKYDSLKSLLQKYNDVINEISDEEHQIQIELDASKTMREYLDEDTRKLLFNQDDYIILSKELDTIRDKAIQLQIDYKKAIATATEETLPKITSQYQMQYDLLMKSYEISKADLEVAKKRQKLNNVLNERSVRMFINGQWQWVADTQNVIDAQNELSEAEYSLSRSKTQLSQQKDINTYQSLQDNISVQTALLDTDLENWREKWESIQNEIEGESQDLYQLLNDMANSDVPALESIVENLGFSLSSLYYSITGESIKVPQKYDTNVDDYLDKILSSDNMYEVIRLNKERNEKLDYLSPGEVGFGEKKYDTLGILEYWETNRKELQNLKKLEPFKKINTNDMLISIGNQVVPIDILNKTTNDSKNTLLKDKNSLELSSLWKLNHNNIRTDFGNSNISKTTQDNRIIINNLTVDNGSSNGRALNNAIRRYVGNH